MNPFEQIAEKIIEEQELVIGPLAWVEANKVEGLHADPKAHAAVVNGDPKETINRLVAQYERLFGRASIEVCREAAAPILSGLTPTDVPSSLVA